MAFRVVLTDFVADDLAVERQILDGVATIESVNAKSAADLPAAIVEADAVIAYHLVHWDAALLGRLAKCKVLARGGVGTDNVDLIAARARGIPVVNVPDYGTEEVADSAFAMLLGLARGTNLYNRHWQRGLGPWNHTPAKPLTRLRGKVCGIVGFGRIGQAFALRAKAVGMDIVFNDPNVSDGTEKTFGVRRVESLDELLAQSFALSLHCPRTPATVKLIDAAAIAKMPRGSYLINTSRGEVVETNAIPAAIRSGHLAGAGIDVFAVEPPREDDPLVRAWQDPADPCHERVILTPHAAFYSEEGLRHIRVKTAEACRRALTGQPLRNVVN
jgi:D-3-phosphoglycerate dehydrogenase/C-terminal binding protein